MKKIFITLVSIVFLATTAIADIARIEVGTGAWIQNTKGVASYSQSGADGSYISNEEENTQSYIWALIKHPIPILPNLRLEYVSLEDKGLVTGKFKEFDVGGVTTSMTYDMKQYDIIPYYNILDNTARITLDLGIDIKIIDTSYEVTAKAPFSGYKSSETIVLPLLYLRGRVEIPLADIGVEADVKYIKVGDSTVYDIRAKVDYTLEFIPVIQPAIELGYRIQKIDIDEDDADSKIDLEFSGIYMGLMLRF